MDRINDEARLEHGFNDGIDLSNKVAGHEDANAIAYVPNFFSSAVEYGDKRMPTSQPSAKPSTTISRFNANALKSSPTANDKYATMPPSTAPVTALPTSL